MLKEFREDQGTPLPRRWKLSEAMPFKQFRSDLTGVALSLAQAPQFFRRY